MGPPTKSRKVSGCGRTAHDLLIKIGTMGSLTITRIKRIVHKSCAGTRVNVASGPMFPVPENTAAATFAPTNCKKAGKNEYKFM